MGSLFMPSIREKIERAERQEDLIFTHTTSFEALKSIISNSELWMSNIPNFIDKQEITYGKRIVDTLVNGHFGSWLNKHVGDIGSLTTFVEYYEECVGKAGTPTEKFLYDQSFAFCLREDTVQDIEYMWKNYCKNTEDIGCMIAFDARYLCGMFRDKGGIDDAMFLLAPMLYFDIRYDRKCLQSEIAHFKTVIKELQKYQDTATIQIEIILSLMSFIELLKRRKSNTEDYYKEKEWRILYAPILYDRENPHPAYNKKSYCRKSYSGDGKGKSERLIYDQDRNVYKLKLGRWEGGNSCDWNRMIRSIHIGPGDEKRRRKTYDDVKECLASVGANGVVVTMN